MKFSISITRITVVGCLAKPGRQQSLHGYNTVQPSTAQHSIAQQSTIVAEWCTYALLFVQVRPPMPFVHFFLIDVSYNAVTSGALQATCSAVARTLDDLQGVAHVFL